MTAARANGRPVPGEGRLRPIGPDGGAPDPGAAGGWQAVCPLHRLQPGRGVAALLGDRQVALFRLVSASSGADVVYAIDNLDPCSGAAVLSRGIVGDRQGEPVVASPIYKQAFSLETGKCLDDPSQEVEVFAVRVVDGWVQVESP